MDLFSWSLAPVPFAVHAAAMLADEAWFHRRRGLPRWERLGHPADTATVLACYLLALFLNPASLWIFIVAAAASTLFVMKDEWVHARTCTGGEMFLHAFLFSMHPVLLFLAGASLAASAAPAAESLDGFRSFLAVQAGVTGAFLLWQVLFWNGPWAPALPDAEGNAPAEARRERHAAVGMDR